MRDFKEVLNEVLYEVGEFLLEKNRKYGNSALTPIRVFSKADPEEQIKVRMDDKLSRLRQAEPDDAEDAIRDLLGYLVLLLVHRKLTEEGASC
jgi:hypothetical protein